MQENLICSVYQMKFFFFFFLASPKSLSLLLLLFARCLPVFIQTMALYLPLFYLFIFLFFNGQRREIEGINLELLMQ